MELCDHKTPFGRNLAHCRRTYVLRFASHHHTARDLRSESPRGGPGWAVRVKHRIGIRSGLDAGVIRSITSTGPGARAPPRAAVRASAGLR
eukprot:1046995-Prymnesium_polylepis.1